MTIRPAVLVLVAALMVSCGGLEPPSLSPRARVELETKVAAARAAAAAHDADGARRELAATRDRVDALERADRISPTQAAAIRDAATRVEGLLDLVTTTTTTLPPVVPEPDNGSGERPGKGKGKGKGKG